MLRARALLDNIRRYWVLVFAAACLPLAILYLDDLYLQASGRLQFDAAWLLMAAITQFSVWLALALGWRETVTCCAHFRIGVRDAFAHLGLFTAGKYLPGKVWGALARGTRLGQAGSTLGGAAQATLVEQVLVFHSAAALCALIGAWVLDDAWRLPLAAVALILLLAGLPIGRIGVSTARAVLVLLRPQMETAAIPAISAPAYMRLFAIYFLAWFLHGLVLVCVAAAFLGHEPEARLVASMVFANAAAMLVGFVAVFAPAGIGVRDATLASLLAVSMPLADAALLAIVARMFSVAADLVAGTLAVLPASPGRSTDQSPDR
jgi:hypothetical protein